MSKKSQEFELKVVQGLNYHAPMFTVIHTGNNSRSADIEITYNNYQTYVEAKISGAQFGTPRLKYFNNEWSGITDNPITASVSSILNIDPHAHSFIEYSKRLYSVNNLTHLVPLYSVFKNNTDCHFTYDALVTIIKNIGNQYIYREPLDENLLTTIINYYKIKNVDYIQVSDNLYQINDNTLSNIPSIHADVELSVRLVNRRTKRWFEVVPTLKLKNLVESDYSVLLNTKKINPFKHL